MFGLNVPTLWERVGSLKYLFPWMEKRLHFLIEYWSQKRTQNGNIHSTKLDAYFWIAQESEKKFKNTRSKLDTLSNEQGRTDWGMLEAPFTTQTHPLQIFQKI